MKYVYTSIMFVYVNTYSYLCIKKMRYLSINPWGSKIPHTKTKKNMELSNYQASNIGWLLSDIVDNIQIQGNGIATVKFAVTAQQLYSVAKFLEQFKYEVLNYESFSITDNCKKLNDYIELLEH